MTHCKIFARHLL